MSFFCKKNDKNGGIRHFFNIYLYFCAEKLIALTKRKLTLLQPKNYLNYGI